MTRSASLTAMSAILAQRVGAPTPVALESLEWERLDADTFTSQASRHRVVSLLETSEGATHLPSRTRAALRARHREAMLRGMRQTRDLIRLAQAYDEIGIPFLMLKGQAFSAEAYGDPFARGIASDIDLLIAPESIRAAHDAMVELGYYCAHDEGHVAPLHGWRGTYHRWLHYERFYMSPGRTSVDVHWRPVPGAASWTDFDRLVESSSHIVLHGQEMNVPGPGDALRIAAGQGEPDGWPTLRSAVDVLAAAALLTPDTLAKLTTDPLVRAALGHAREVLRVGNPLWWSRPDPRARQRHLVREWQLRRRTDSTPRAVARSVLGMWLPARRLTPMDPLSRDPQVSRANKQVHP